MNNRIRVTVYFFVFWALHQPVYSYTPTFTFYYVPKKASNYTNLLPFFCVQWKAAWIRWYLEFAEKL